MAEIIAITAGEQDDDCAFPKEKLDRWTVHPADLSAELVQALRPFSKLLGDNRGIALMNIDGKVKIAGLNLEKPS